MQLGMIGLGRMGANMVRRLMGDGHACVVYDRDDASVGALAAEGATGAESLESLVAALQPPRHVWIMIPAGQVDGLLERLTTLLAANDLVVDGGNSNFRDGTRRAGMLAARGLHFMDVGTSGGVWGGARGYCLMAGGDAEDFQRMEPALRSLAPGRDAAPASAAREPYEFDLAAITELWRRGSVIGSWLLDLTAEAPAGDPELAAFGEEVADSGEGRWTVQTAVDLGVPAHVLGAALFARFASRGNDAFASRVLSAMRYGFGGHREKRD